MSDAPAAGQGLVSDGWRYLIAGGLNTLLTIAVYQAALFAVPSAVAYALAWAVGLVLVVWAYPRFVFKGGRRDTGSRLALAVNVGIGFVIGLAANELFVRWFGQPRLAILFSVALTTIYGFLSARLILRRRG